MKITNEFKKSIIEENKRHLANTYGIKENNVKIAMFKDDTLESSILTTVKNYKNRTYLVKTLSPNVGSKGVSRGIVYRRLK